MFPVSLPTILSHPLRQAFFSPLLKKKLTFPLGTEIYNSISDAYHFISFHNRNGDWPFTPEPGIPLMKLVQYFSPAPEIRFLLGKALLLPWHRVTPEWFHMTS